MVLGKLPVPGESYNLDDSRARAYCACSRYEWGLFGHFLRSSILSLLFLPLSERRPDIDLKTVSKGRLTKNKHTNKQILQPLFTLCYLAFTCVSVSPVFMPPTSEKLRGHIGLGLSVRPFVRSSVCPSVRLSVGPSVRLSVARWQLRNSRTPSAGILKLYMWHVHEK